MLETPQHGGALNAIIVKGARLDEGDEVLDVGSGYGQPGLSAARLVGPTGRVVLTNPSSEMLVAARERADGEGLEGVECVVMDGDELDFDSPSFDAVISRHGLQFLADVPAAPRRLHSFLKTDGRFSATVWSGGLRSASDSIPGPDGGARGCSEPSSAVGRTGAQRARRR